MPDQIPPYPQSTPPSYGAPPPPPNWQGGYYGPPGGPGGGYPPPPPPPPRPQVVHIVAKPGGFARAFGFFLGMFVLAAVFVIGLMFGMTIVAAMSNYDSVVVRRTYREGGSKLVAVIPVMGGIDERQAEFVHAAVQNVLGDKSIRAVVLRVDSPGGSVAPSDQIWYEVERLKKAGLPVVASYGGVAASGGYYVSCGANSIIAQETCITGSIGVIAQILTMEGLLNKVGVTPVTLVASGSPEKDVANDVFRAWNDADKTKVRIMLDSAYAAFNKRVKDGRSKVISDPAKIDSLANGSIYTAQQAKDNGLIDGIGYLDDAIAQAESLAGMPKGAGTVITVHQPPTLLGGLMSHERVGGAASWDADTVRGLINDLGSPRAMYLMH